MCNNKEHYHNKGQEDRSDGNYEPPHGLMDSLTTWGSSEMERHNEENKSYSEGWNNTDDQKSSGGCFLSTACIEHAGLDDDCEELTVLRHFRDTYVVNRADGQQVLNRYYATAPRIVTAMHQAKTTDTELPKIYAGIKKAIHLITTGENEAAFGLYSDMFNELNSNYGG